MLPGVAGKPREVIELAAFDLAKERMIDQALMAQESKRRNYLVDPAELAQGMKQWLKQNGGKKAFQKNKHPLIKDQEDLKRNHEPDPIQSFARGRIGVLPGF